MNQQVTREQFEADTRVSRIRAYCLEIVRRMEEKHHNPAQSRGVIRARLEDLRRMEITPNMHVGKPSAVFNDPRTLAEYVAGQILQNVDKNNLFLHHTIINVTYRMLDAE